MIRIQSRILIRTSNYGFKSGSERPKKLRFRNWNTASIGKDQFVKKSKIKFYFRECRATLKEAVPLLTTYEALKTHFDWLSLGKGISHITEENLGEQLKNLELYLR